MHDELSLVAESESGTCCGLLIVVRRVPHRQVRDGVQELLGEVLDAVSLASVCRVESYQQARAAL